MGDVGRWLRIVAVLLVVFLAWIWAVSPKLADLRFRNAAEDMFRSDLYLRMKIPPLREKIRPLYKGSGSDEIFNACAEGSIAAGKLGDDVARIEALQYALRGPGKQQIAARFAKNATAYWREEQGAIEAWCDAANLLVVEAESPDPRPLEERQRDTIRALIEFSDRRKRARGFADERDRVWNGLSAVLFDFKRPW